MARKRATFQSIRDDQVEVPPDVPARPDRGAARAESRELAALATRVCKLPPGRIDALPLDPPLIEALHVLRRSGADSGRRRQLKRVVSLLRQTDLEALQHDLAGRGAEDTRLRELERWRSRIIAEGDPAIQDFVDTHPDVDRGQIRALTRQARGEGAAAPRAAKRLFGVLKQAVQSAPDHDASEE